MRESTSLLPRLYRYGAVLVGHGWNMAAFWIATVYSVWTVVMPLDVQKKVMLAIHVDPAQRLAIWGFGLAAFFLYAGFRAWNDAENELANPKDLPGPNPKHDTPSLIVHFREVQVTQRAYDIKEPPYFLTFHMEILNSGTPTSLHDWQGSYTLNNDLTTVLAEKDFDRKTPLVGGRNLVSDDKT